MFLLSSAISVYKPHCPLLSSLECLFILKIQCHLIYELGIKAILSLKMNLLKFYSLTVPTKSQSSRPEHMELLLKITIAHDGKGLWKGQVEQGQPQYSRSPGLVGIPRVGYTFYILTTESVRLLLLLDFCSKHLHIYQGGIRILQGTL